MSFFTPVYQTNDDAEFALLVSGKVISDAPDEHITPTNILIGKALKALYTLGWDIPWYGFYIFSVHFFSMVAFLYALLRHKLSPVRYLFFIIYFFTVELALLMSTQFTTTSFVSAQAGIFLVVISPGEKRKGWLLASSAALLFFSSLIRLDGFFLTLLLSVPLLVFAFAVNYSKKSIAVFVSFFAIVIALSLAAGRYNNYYYEKNDAWKDYLRYRGPLLKFTDYRTAVFVPETGRIFEKAGWSQNDYYMLTYWFFSDKEVFSLSKMRDIVTKFPPYKKYIPLKYVFSPLKEMLEDRSILYMVICFVFFIFYIENKRRIFTVLATLALVSMVSAYLMFFKKLPPHVYLIFFAYVSSLSLFFTRADFPGPAKKRTPYGIRIIYIAFLIMLSTASIYRHVEVGRSNRLEHQKIKLDVAAMAQKDAVSLLSEDSLFVAWTFLLERLVLPLENVDCPSRFRIYWPSLLVYSPIADQTLERFGIEDIYKGLYEKNNVFLLSNEMLNVFYAKYVLEHYGAVVSTPAYFRFGDYGVYKPVRVR